jgi:hypothetical protein
MVFSQAQVNEYNLPSQSELGPASLPVQARTESLGALPGDARTGPRSGPLGQAKNTRSCVAIFVERHTGSRASGSALRSCSPTGRWGRGVAWLHDGSCMSERLTYGSASASGCDSPGLLTQEPTCGVCPKSRSRRPDQDDHYPSES